MDTAETAKNPPHKHGVVAVLQDEHGRYLVIKRALTLVRAPGWWCFVGGEVERGESLEVAIVREVLEEVGLDVAAIEKIHESVSPNGEYLLHWLRVNQVAGGGSLRPNPAEVAEARWLTAADALKLEPILPGLKAWLSTASL
jgi:8-oxo-dGTP diphosphatase